VEVAKTVLEVAEVAWAAAECCHRHHKHHDAPAKLQEKESKGDTCIETLQSHNNQLRKLLERNLALLRDISDAPCLLQTLPSDLHDRITKMVDSDKFLVELEAFREKSSTEFPFEEPSDLDLEKVEVLSHLDPEKPSWWVWVPEETAHINSEEKSEIDNENYVVVKEEDVVDGVAQFMAKCIMANPKAKNLSPSELQKALSKALEGMNKFEKMLNIWHAGRLFFTLATWGVALFSLSQGRTALRFAALGVHHSSRLALKAL
ncbi:hypothetical protein M569_01598, partial [Genlisea aurea]